MCMLIHIIRVGFEKLNLPRMTISFLASGIS